MGVLVRNGRTGILGDHSVGRKDLIVVNVRYGCGVMKAVRMRKGTCLLY